MNTNTLCKNKDFDYKLFITFLSLGFAYIIIRALFFSDTYYYSNKIFLNFIIFAPIIEEWTFRGIIQKNLLQYLDKRILGISLANILASFLFSVIHLFYNSILHSIAVFIPSLIFGITYEKCGKIYLSILLHSFYNLNVFII